MALFNSIGSSYPSNSMRSSIIARIIARHFPAQLFTLTCPGSLVMSPSGVHTSSTRQKTSYTSSINLQFRNIIKSGSLTIFEEPSHTMSDTGVTDFRDTERGTRCSGDSTTDAEERLHCKTGRIPALCYGFPHGFQSPCSLCNIFGDVEMHITEDEAIHFTRASRQTKPSVNHGQGVFASLYIFHHNGMSNDLA